MLRDNPKLKEAASSEGSDAAASDPGFFILGAKSKPPLAHLQKPSAKRHEHVSQGRTYLCPCSHNYIDSVALVARERRRDAEDEALQVGTQFFTHRV